MNFSECYYSSQINNGTCWVGHHLFAAEKVTITNNGKFKKVSTMKIPYSHCEKISSRTDLAHTNQIWNNMLYQYGTICCINEQKLYVLLKNDSNHHYQVKIGEKIGELIFFRIHTDL